MSSLLNNCDSCASLILSPCEDIYLAAGLTPDTAYWWFVTDQFGNVWHAEATTDVNGVLTIYESNFPDGFLSSGIGTLTIEIKETETSLETVALTFNNVPYDCLQVSFSNIQVLQYEEIFFGLNDSYCADEAAAVLTEPEPGGSFAGDGVLFFDGDGQWYFDPNSAGVGSHQVTWVKGSRVLEETVTVYALPITSLLPADITVDPSEIPFYPMVGGLPEGGVYYVDGVATEILDTNAIAKGSHDVSYIYTDSHGCSSVASQVLNIIDAEDPPPEETPSPDYVEVICTTYTMTTYEYTPGKFVDFYKETCNTNTDRPVFLGFHAGGGNRAQYKTFPKDFASRGYLGGSADYGQSNPNTGAQQKEQVIYIMYLIWWCKTNAALLGTDGVNVVIGGTSAGALASIQTTIIASALNNSNPAIVAAAHAYLAGASNYSLLSGIDLSLCMPNAAYTQSGSANSGFRGFIYPGGKPVFMHHGDEDCTVYYSADQCGSAGALETYNLLQAAGIAATFVPYNGEAHDLGGHHSTMLLGAAGVQVVGVADPVYASNTFGNDIGIVQKFKNLLT